MIESTSTAVAPSANFDAASDVDSPAYQCEAYRAMLPALKIVQDCFEGTPAIKRVGQTYLPKEEKEKEAAYAIRLKRSTYWNAFRRSAMGLVGMVFRKAPTFKSDIPELIRKQLDDVDLMRSRFDVFLQQALKWHVVEGNAAILVDMPPAITASNPKATLADERGRRPYWSLYRQHQVINWRFDDSRLVQVTLAEEIGKPAGKYGEKRVKRFRVLRPGSWELFETDDNGKVTPSASGETSLQEIPIAFTARTITSVPPLLDLAYENLRHYRLQSDLDHILHVANVPILVEDLGDQEGLEGMMAGGKPTEAAGQKPERTISPNAVYQVGKGGSLKYVEHGSAAVGKAQEEIKITRSNMAKLGLALIMDSPDVSSTATENVLDYESETSELAGMAVSLEDAANLALMFQAQFQQIDDGGAMKINREFTRWRLDGPLVTGLSFLVEKKAISLETMWYLLEHGEMPPSLQPKEELARILNDAALLGSIRPPDSGTGGPAPSIS